MPVEPKAFRVLLFLLRNPGRLVKKDEILNAVWDDCSVSDNSLTRSIATLRRLLGDDSREPRYIATVQTIGYRFLCAVEAIDDRTGKPEFPTTETRNESKNVYASQQRSDPTAKSSRRIAWIVVGGVVLAACLGFLWLIRAHLFGRQQITEQQITRNSNDNPVMNAAISGDGKYLAFSDSHGIHIQLLATGEMRDIAQAGGVSRCACYLAHPLATRQCPIPCRFRSHWDAAHHLAGVGGWRSSAQSSRRCTGNVCFS